jgi:RimJ/RimL family protein N-acetyltransferase
MDGMRLETPRLLLLPWERSDRDLLRPIATDPEVMRYITNGAPWSEDRIVRFIERQITSLAEHGYCRWKLVEKASGRTIGFCGAGSWRDLPLPEIGWWLARDAWGKGYATEAARAALEDLFGRIGLARVTSIAMPANLASLHVMEKLGLRPECEFDHEGMRLLRYGVSREEYLAAHRQGD